MTQEHLAVEDVVALRKRVEYEDQLLNSRTSIVLTLNGLMAVAVSLSLPAAARALVTLIIIIVNALWIVCSLDAQHYIHSLTARIHSSGRVPIDENVRSEVQKGRFRIGSTRFMSLIVPSLLLTGWVIGLLLVIWKP